ncbi:hypothetical protein HYC85_016876 [Camellia sinensis]|uniref:Uncharacterized protein n=1 Tax=Camellia sinensis TaxID=4442 RepID=A0A7J7H4J9_CAMSI|nr:hypothetical protein HYC85_016876 [Camellia sinensis]
MDKTLLQPFYRISVKSRERVTVKKLERGGMYMDINVQEEATFEGKMRKKTKKNKKNEASASKEDGFELSKEDKRRKKAEVSSDVELDGTQNEDIDIKDISVHEETIFEGKVGKKTKKKQKREASASKEAGDYNGAMLNEMEDGFELSKADKRRKKDKKKAEVSSDVELDGTQNEDIDIKDISVQEVAIFEGKMGRKTKKKQKSEASASKEVSDYNGEMLNGVEDGFELSKEDKRRKKDKKKAEVSSNVELDGTQNEDIDIKDISVQEAAIFEGKMGKKTKKKQKSEASASKEVSDYNGAMLNGVEDGFELSKEDKRRKKDKKKAEVSSDVELDGTRRKLKSHIDLTISMFLSQGWMTTGFLPTTMSITVVSKWNFPQTAPTDEALNSKWVNPIHTSNSFAGLDAHKTHNLSKFISMSSEPQIPPMEQQQQHQEQEEGSTQSKKAAKMEAAKLEKQRRRE